MIAMLFFLLLELWNYEDDDDDNETIKTLFIDNDIVDHNDNP